MSVIHQEVSQVFQFLFLIFFIPGVLELHIEDELRVEGVLHSNGENGGDDMAGGGAGGSILIFANHLDGLGQIEAKGGRDQWSLYLCTKL